MLIGIDGNEANIDRKVGIGEYNFELSQQFEEFHPPDGRIKFQIYLKNSPLPHLPKERNGWRYRIIKPKKLWTQFALPLDLYFHKPRPDVFFSPTHYAPRFSSVPTVISVMDLSYIRFPEMFKKNDLYQLQNWTSYSVRNAKKIFTISEASKNDIIKFYKVEPEKVVVTYPGIKLKAQMSNLKSISKNAKLIKDKYGIDGDYILFVGTVQPRKNLVRLIEAFSRITDPKVSLVIVGKKGWLYEEIFEAPKKFSVEDRVKFLNYVSDEDLQLLYKNALCFTLPSLYEGFGLPVLEAMANGCPVVISKTSSLPEVGGDAAIYVDPENVENIAEGLQKILSEEKLRKELIEKGYKQVKKFSWERTARETLKVLEEVVNK